MTVTNDAEVEANLARARAGDEEAFEELTEPHRRELQVHCYRILGSLQDAEDLVQETLLAAWRGLERFEGRASLRAWLYRIATNRCLNMLRDRGRRPQEVPPMAAPEPTRRTEPLWLEPYPDALLEGVAEASRRRPSRATSCASRSGWRSSRRFSSCRRASGRCSCCATCSASRTPRSRTCSTRATPRSRAPCSAPGRSCATQVGAGDRERAPAPNSARERELVGRFADAVESGDVDEVVALLTDDALLTMPPQPLEYRGHEAIAAFLRHRAELRGAPLHVVPTRANSQPAFGCYLPDPHAAIARPYGMIVLTLEGDAVAAITWFGDTGVLRQFGLPRTLPSR